MRVFVGALALLAACVDLPQATAQSTEAAVPGRVVRLDPRLDRLVPHRAVLEKLADGFAWVEGPVWNRRDAALLFSDIPNDAVFASNGDLYFTDPPFGLPGAFDDPRKELDFQGVYRLAEDGSLTLLTRALKAPNGLAFSPDEKTLYVFAPDGVLLGFIETGAATSNVAWGEDGGVLFVTADQALHRIRLSTTGAGYR